MSSGLRNVALTFLILAQLLSACAMPGLTSAPVAVASRPNQSPTPHLILVPPDASPTATPFQPLPPTAVYFPTEIPTSTPTPAPTATPKPASQPANPAPVIDPPSDQINILILGTDRRARQTHFRTDTIIIASLNPSSGTVSLISFPRDLYLFIPGWGYERLNTAFSKGGFKKIKATLKQNFGIKLDHYILVNFDVFKKAVDGLGKLEVNVGTALRDYCAGYGYVNYPVGIKKMNADVALCYVRSRKTSNDFARNRRQQEILIAVLNKFLSLNALVRAPELFRLYSQSATTDLTLGDILPLIPLAAKIRDTSRISNYYIGPKQTYDWITPGGGMVLLPRRDAIMRVLQKAMGE